MTVSFASIILAGGRSSRMGAGQNKVTLEVEGRPLVASAVAAVQAATQTVLVGPEAPLREALPGKWASHLTHTREDPPFGGPVAGILAGLSVLSEDSPGLVALLACDVPGSPAAMQAVLSSGPAQQLAGSPDVDGVCALAPDGHIQWLLGLYRKQFLMRRSAQISGQDNLSVRRFLGPATLAGIEVPARSVQDVDTPQDLRHYLTLSAQQE